MGTMKRLFFTFLLILIYGGCASLENPEHPSGLVIIETRPDKETAMTKQNLLHLAQVYDLSPFLFTKRVMISSESKATAKPILTLGTEEAEAPKLLLANFLGLELDWWLSTKKELEDAALAQLRKIYPKVPQAEALAAHRELLLSFLKMRALEFYLGKVEARLVMQEISKKMKPTRWADTQVLRQDNSVQKVVETIGLYPPALR